jgi:type IV secretion system protein VirB11
MSINIVALEEYLKPFRFAMEDESVNEIVINTPGQLWIERSGKFEMKQIPLLDQRHLLGLAKLLARFSEQRLSEKEPLLSGILPSGHRVQLILPPATSQGCVVICIRKQTLTQARLADYVERGAFLHTQPRFLDQKLALPLSPGRDEEELQTYFARQDYARFLMLAIQMKKNILIAGATSTGKTTFLNACLQEIPLNEHVVTLEDVAEVKPPHPLHTALFTSKGLQGTAQITMQDLVQASLRIRPDRIIMGEIRGAEAIDFMNASATGHDGSLSSVHAGSVAMAFMRLVHMMKLTGTNLSRDDLLTDLVMTVDIVVQLKRRLINDTLRREVSEIYYVHAKPTHQ